MAGWLGCHPCPGLPHCLPPAPTPARRLRPTFEEIDRELVRIEMDFRLHHHRSTNGGGGGNSKRASSASQGGGSAASSRPASPGPRGVGGGAARQCQASSLL